jgi:hypothetical protein
VLSITLKVANCWAIHLGIICKANYTVQFVCTSNVDYTSWCTHPAGYVGSYGNPNANYPVNPYNAGYNMNQVCLLLFRIRINHFFFHILFSILISSCFSKHTYLFQANATDSGPQYGAASTHSSWGGYDMQRAPGRR